MRNLCVAVVRRGPHRRPLAGNQVERTADSLDVRHPDGLLLRFAACCGARRRLCGRGERLAPERPAPARTEERWATRNSEQSCPRSRHVASSLWLAAGVEPQKVSRWLGHATHAMPDKT